MDLSKFGPKDKKIITDHPGAEPYTLLMEHGLTQKAYDRLVSMSETQKTEPMSNILSVETESLNTEVKPQKITKVINGTSRVKDLATGREFNISSYHARFLHKKKYAIIG